MPVDLSAFYSKRWLNILVFKCSFSNSTVATAHMCHNNKMTGALALQENLFDLLTTYLDLMIATHAIAQKETVWVCLTAEPDN